ncbi:MAG: DUF4149 domain-containing protein [Pseudomonadota bacterium]
MAALTLLLASTLFGGMVFFSFGFAPVLFAQLPMAQVRPLLRGTFPYYYLSLIGVSAIASAAAFTQSQRAGLLLALICMSTVYARQILMAQINSATDGGDEKLFKRLHGLSVGIQLVQIGLAAWAVVLLG